MCACIGQINEALAEKNAMLDIPQMIHLKTGKTYPGWPMLKLLKLDSGKRGRLPTLFCFYCPFCGEQYPPAPGQEVSG